MTDEQAEELPGLDQAAVEAWMVNNVEGFVAPAEFSLIAGGHSNITYSATDASGTGYVMRRPPLGSTGGKAHDMGREYRIISALWPTAVPVPRSYALCDDIDVNGAPFYVMSRIEGEVVDNPEVADSFLNDSALRRRGSEQIVDVMADMHRVDIDAAGLGEAARREGYLDRQLSRFQKVWEQNKTRELPIMAELASQLVELAPAQRYTGIVHGDYRLGNVMLDSEGTLVAVLDWELWTLGDVLADLGFILNNWYEPNDDSPQVWMEVPPTVAGGFLTRAEVLERYATQTGFDVSAVQYYQAFQHWKVAALAEGVKRRYESAQMVSTDVDFEHMNQRVIDLADMAQAHLDGYRLTL